MTTLELRPCTLADREIVEAILTVSYGALLKGFYPDGVLQQAVPFMSVAQPALLKSGTYYLMFVDGEPAACGGWSRVMPGAKKRYITGTAHIRHVATHPDFLRKGLARRILDHSFDAAKKRKAVKMSCFSSLSAVAFYKSVGFHEIGKKSVQFTGDLAFDMMVMERSL